MVSRRLVLVASSKVSPLFATRFVSPEVALITSEATASSETVMVVVLLASSSTDTVVVASTVGSVLEFCTFIVMVTASLESEIPSLMTSVKVSAIPPAEEPYLKSPVVFVATSSPSLSTR